MTEKSDSQKHKSSETALTVIGLALAVIGTVPFFFTITTSAGKVLTVVISLLIATGFVIAVRLWPISKLNRWFIGITGSALGLLLVSLFVALRPASSPSGAVADQGAATDLPLSGEAASSEMATESILGVDQPVYLDQLESLGTTDLVTGTAVVDGRTYEHALLDDMDSRLYCGDAQSEDDRYNSQGSEAEFNLERKYESFQATIGLTDDANSGTTYKFWVYGDDELLSSATVALGEPANLTVEVDNVLRLRLVQNDCGSMGAVVWADPVLTPAR
jgi:hypothetical protein